jgi:hypothetical protein
MGKFQETKEFYWVDRADDEKPKPGKIELIFSSVDCSGELSLDFQSEWRKPESISITTDNIDEIITLLYELKQYSKFCDE